MPNKNLTDITVILDKSGSMNSCKNDAEGGLNSFIKNQREDNLGEVRFSLVEFNNTHKYVCRDKPIKDVEDYKFIPSGNTALLDTVGHVINDLGQKFRDMKEKDRPGLVIVAIITDGEENSSREFTLKQVRDMISHQQSVYNWQFTFLGANQDAFQEGQKLGIQCNAIANYSQNKIGETFSALDSNVRRMKTSGISGQHVNCSYTSTERSAMG